jgi:hypothetical protein
MIGEAEMEQVDGKLSLNPTALSVADAARLLRTDGVMKRIGMPFASFLSGRPGGPNDVQAVTPG